MMSGHIQVKNGTHHLFYMAIARHTTESVHVLSYHCILGTTFVSLHLVSLKVSPCHESYIAYCRSNFMSMYLVL